MFFSCECVFGVQNSNVHRDKTIKHFRTLLKIENINNSKTFLGKDKESDMLLFFFLTKKRRLFTIAKTEARPSTYQQQKERLHISIYGRRNAMLLNAG